MPPLYFAVGASESILGDSVPGAFPFFLVGPFLWGWMLSNLENCGVCMSLLISIFWGAFYVFFCPLVRSCFYVFF